MADLATYFRAYMSDKDKNGYSSLYATLFTHLRQPPLCAS